MFNFDILLQSNYQHPETFEDFLNIGYRTFNDRYFRNAYANKLMNDAYYQGFKQGSDIGPKGKEPLKIEPEEQDSTTEIIEETNIISPATYQDAINNSSPSDIVAKINKKTGQITYYKNYDNINETAQKYLKNNDLVKGVIDDYINLEKLPKSINKNTKISIYDFAKKETSTTKFDKFGDNFSKREKKIKYNEQKKMEKIITFGLYIYIYKHVYKHNASHIISSIIFMNNVLYAYLLCVYIHIWENEINKGAATGEG